MDRHDAGLRLASRLERYRGEAPIVLALPRGGVAVGAEVARALGAPLDVVLVRKLGAPQQPELAIGAVVGAAEPEVVLDEETIALLGATAEHVAREIETARVELARRERVYRGDRPPPDLAGRTVIVVDDGIATGASVRAALRAIRRAAPRRLVLAVPVAPPETVAALRPEVDDLVCLETPEIFGAVGMYYEDFAQLTDAEVLALLARAP